MYARRPGDAPKQNYFSRPPPPQKKGEMLSEEDIIRWQEVIGVAGILVACALYGLDLAHSWTFVKTKSTATMTPGLSAMSILLGYSRYLHLTIENPSKTCLFNFMYICFDHVAICCGANMRSPWRTSL